MAASPLGIVLWGTIALTAAIQFAAVSTGRSRGRLVESRAEATSHPPGARPAQTTPHPTNRAPEATQSLQAPDAQEPPRRQVNPRARAAARITTKVLYVPLLLAALTVTGRSSGTGFAPIVIAGLLCGFAGDAILELPWKYSFMAGLGAFLAGHVLYTIWFIDHLAVFSIGTAAALAVVAGSVIVGVRTLVPGAGPAADSSMRRAVAVYAATLFVSLFFAAGAAVQGWRGGTAAAIGTALFIVSDTILGIREFTGRITAAHIPIMATYFSAQLLIGLSALL